MLVGHQRLASGSFCTPSHPGCHPRRTGTFLPATFGSKRCYHPAAGSIPRRQDWCQISHRPVAVSPKKLFFGGGCRTQWRFPAGEGAGVIAQEDEGSLKKQTQDESNSEKDKGAGELPLVRIIAKLQAHVVEIFQLLFGWVGKIPAWQRQRQLRNLQMVSDEDPTDADKHARFLTLLNKVSPLEVLDRVESGKYASNSLVVVEYINALVVSGRLTEYAKEEGPANGQDHRSMDKLLQDLQVLSGGGDLEMSPGASPKVPLHVYLEQGTASRSSTGVFDVLSGMIRWMGALAVLSFLWLLGSGVVKKMSMQNLPANGFTPTSRDKTPSVAPKQFIKEELPEKSIKTFDDVKGCSESKEELGDVVEFLKNPDKFTRMGATLPKGVLLTGPPGTGKTLLARAVAGEAGVPFFYRAGSEFEEMFVGVGSRRVRALFNAAKKNAPCIVFIDEIDAIGASRKHWENQTRKTLNQLLVEMDGFEVNEGIIVMGATNLPETLDPALTRAGRFDRHITVPLPDVKGRQEIAEYYLRDKPVGESVDPEQIAQQTRGFSGAEIYNLVNEAALMAAKGDKPNITKELVEQSRDKILMGMERKSLVRTEESVKRTAYHESGHALVAVNTQGANKIHKATIVARGNALGMVAQMPGKDEFSVSRQQLIAQIDVCMGGKVAEELVFGRDNVTTGATSDLQQATATAEHMVMQCGMSDEIGPVFIQNRSNLSADIQRKIDAEVSKILKDAQQRVTKLLTEKMSDLHTLSKALLERETLSCDEILDLVGDKRIKGELHVQQQS
ncbi:hypothetical protein BSKO_00302 [Bryopsis sp. KO-2023]|nr:hypothetical protein BSKO_00302 [Bryopsis sp. KO-2023]